MVLLQAILHTTDYNGRTKGPKLFYYPDSSVPDSVRALASYSKALNAEYPLWEMHIDLAGFNVNPGVIDRETLETLGITPLVAL